MVEIFTVEPTINEDEGNGLGGIILETLGGLPPYSYQWSNGVTIGEIHNLTPGIYGVTITDANGCSEELFLPVNIITGVEDLGEITEVYVFPNPNTKDNPLNIRLNSPNAQHVQIQIFSILGERIVDRKENLILGENLSLIHI